MLQDSITMSSGEVLPCFVHNFLVELESDHLVVLGFFITAKLVKVSSAAECGWDDFGRGMVEWGTAGWRGISTGVLEGSITQMLFTLMWKYYRSYMLAGW